MRIPDGYRGQGQRMWHMVGVFRNGGSVDLPPLGILHALQFVTAKETGEQMVHIEKIEPPDFLQVADYRRSVEVPPETVLSMEIEYIERTPVPRAPKVAQ
jgi:hypothetical protein